MKRYYVHDDCYGDQVEDESSTGPWVKYEDAQAAIQQAVLAERGACADIAADMDYSPQGDIAKAIRARSTP